MPEPALETSEDIVTPEDIARFRASYDPYTWVLYTDEELVPVIIKQRKDQKEREEGERRTPEEKTEAIAKENQRQKEIPEKDEDYYLILLDEFNRQVRTLIQKGVPEMANLTEQRFISILEPLKEHIHELSTKKAPKGHIPFIIVLGEELLSLKKQVPLMELEGEKGYTKMDSDTIKGFKPFEVKIPNGKAYLAVDIETGKTSLGKTPGEAIKKIKSEDRSPLTLEEGVALVTHHPEILKDNHIWMPGSRRGDDGVAHLWLSGGGPRLFWSLAVLSGARWGSASCGSRVGP